ncbi:MAG: FHA domain-containing protein [Planctomycetota bacterium]
MQDHFLVTAAGEAFALTAGLSFVFGRSTSADFVARSTEVSRQHARLTSVESPPGWLLRDLGGRNGTFVNDERLAENGERLLQPGDCIRLGTNTLFHYFVATPDELEAEMERAGISDLTDEFALSKLRAELAAERAGEEPTQQQLQAPPQRRAPADGPPAGGPPQRPGQRPPRPPQPSRPDRPAPPPRPSRPPAPERAREGSERPTARPGERPMERTRPSERAPARPSDRAPARPSDRAPARPGDRAPARPSDRAPARADSSERPEEAEVGAAEEAHAAPPEPASSSSAELATPAAPAEDVPASSSEAATDATSSAPESAVEEPEVTEVAAPQAAPSEPEPRPEPRPEPTPEPKPAPRVAAPVLPLPERGDLREMSGDALLRRAAFARFTGEISFFDGSQRGALSVVGGQPHDGQVSSLSGQAAIDYFRAVTSGTFRTRPTIPEAGSLEQLPGADLLALLRQERATGLVSLFGAEAEKLVGRVVLVEGEVRAAGLARQAGAPALSAISNLAEGSFRFQVRTPDDLDDLLQTPRGRRELIVPA